MEVGIQGMRGRRLDRVSDAMRVKGLFRGRKSMSTTELDGE